MFSLEGLRKVYKYLLGVDKEGRARLIAVVLRARGNGHRLKFKAFHLHARKLTVL